MRKYILISLLFPVLWACDDFLNVKPKAEIIERELFKSAEGFEDALYGAYSSMTSWDLYGSCYSWGYADMFAQYYRLDFLMDNTKALLSLDHKTMQTSYTVMWNSMYESIGYVNNILKNCEKYADNPFPLQHLYKAEALGMRAFMHFDLLRMFAPHINSQPQGRGIPYVKIYEGLVTSFESVTDVYDDVIRDLKAAESLLGDDEELMTWPRKRNVSDKFKSYRELHFNLYAAQATLARVYWMKGDLDSAYVYAKKVIGSGKFPLVNKTEVSTVAAGIVSPKETIWGLYSTDFFNSVKATLYDYSNHKTYLPFKDYLAFYAPEADAGDDYRQKGWFRKPAVGSGQDNTFRCMKVVNEERIDNAGQYSTTEVEGINLLRIPEMYLIAAEAQLEKAPELARQYFDTFIASRGLVKFADRLGNPQITLDDINKERRKEFINEGQYFYTMKRMNMDVYVEVLSATLPGSDDIYTLPIPVEEFDYRESWTTGEMDKNEINDAL